MTVPDDVILKRERRYKQLAASVEDLNDLEALTLLSAVLGSRVIQATSSPQQAVQVFYGLAQLFREDMQLDALHQVEPEGHG